MADSIRQTTVAYLRELSGARSAGTVRAYRNGLAYFLETLGASGLDVDGEPPSALSDEQALDFVSRLQEQHLSPATQRLYMSALKGYLEYLAWKKLAPEIDLAQIARFARRRLPRTGQRLPQFPRQEIEAVIDYAQSLAQKAVENENQRLINLRDRALILTLADTGMRVHEACGLHRGDLDWREGRAVIIGKGDKQDVVRFSERSLRALRSYLEARAPLDGASGRRLSALPLFTGHGRRNLRQAAAESGSRLRLTPLTTRSGRNIVKRRVQEAIGPEAVGSITPHSFRHYFVTTVLRATGGDIHLAQRLARHSSIAITERYAHLANDELDRGYHTVFNQGSATADPEN